MYKQAAELLFDQYEKEGKVTPAKILNHFESKEEQKEAAALFSLELSSEMGSKEKEKALNETVQRIKKNSLDKQSKEAIEQNDIQTLQGIIKEQTGLQKLHISLDCG